MAHFFKKRFNILCCGCDTLDRAFLKPQDRVRIQILAVFDIYSLLTAWEKDWNIGRWIAWDWHILIVRTKITFRRFRNHYINYRKFLNQTVFTYWTILQNSRWRFNSEASRRFIGTLKAKFSPDFKLKKLDQFRFNKIFFSLDLIDWISRSFFSSQRQLKKLIFAFSQKTYFLPFLTLIVKNTL